MNAAYTLYPTCFGQIWPSSEVKPKNYSDQKDDIKKLVEAILSSGSDLQDKCAKILENCKPIKVVELMESVIRSPDFNLEQLKDRLKKLDENFEGDVNEYVKEAYFPYSKAPLKPMQSSLMRESSAIFRFIENFITTFATAFNFFNDDDGPTSIYEKQVLLQIYFRFFQIPLTIAVILQPMLGVAWKVYLATGVIFFAGLAAIQLYVRYLKPLPTTLRYCEDIDALIATSHPDGFGEPSQEMGNLLKHLHFSPHSSKRDPLHIQGVSGIGKTTLAYWLHSMIKHQHPALPEALRDQQKPSKVVLLNLERFMDPKIPFNTILDSVEKDLKGLRDKCQLVVFVDEVGAVQGPPDRMRCLKSFLRLDGVQMIAMTTVRGWQQGIVYQDIDKAFERPFNRMNLDKEWDKKRLENFLWEILFDEAEDLPWDESAIKSTMLLTENLNERAQHAEAAKLLRKAIVFARGSYVPQPKELDIKKTKLINELDELFKNCKKNWPNDSKEDRIKRETLQKQIDEIQKKQNEWRERFRSTREVYKLWLSSKEQLIQIHKSVLGRTTHQIKLDEDLEKRYLFASICERVLKTKADNAIKILEKEEQVNLTVNDQMVKSAYEKPSRDIGPSLTEGEHNILKPIVKRMKEAASYESGYSSLLKQEWNDLCKKFNTPNAFKEFEDFESAVECRLCLKEL
jgi:FtsZ-binding cell division protein ZapB